ncbi:MAG: hypothetical protein ISS36_01735 [Candidatus Aenigmarchaeota archaeon]|nr:hypothetical protein [Candidatus Aenigmarchaeota archaeon]
MSRVPSKEKLRKLGAEATRILEDELRRAGIKYDYAEAIVYDKRTVGVQGDERTWVHVAEVEVKDNGKHIYDTDFLGDLSTRLTNEMRDVNRVVYALI